MKEWLKSLEVVSLGLGMLIGLVAGYLIGLVVALINFSDLTLLAFIAITGGGLLIYGSYSIGRGMGIK